MNEYEILLMLDPELAEERQTEIVTRTRKYNVVLEERVNFGQQVQSSNDAWSSFNQNKDELTKLLDEIEGRRLQDNP